MKPEQLAQQPRYRPGPYGSMIRDDENGTYIKIVDVGAATSTFTDDTTIMLRAAHDVYRRVCDAIRELDRLDAGQGPSKPGHSIRDAAHGLRVLRDELREFYPVE